MPCLCLNPNWSRDPYNLEFLGLPKEAAERDLEQALRDRIIESLREPGPGFAFVGRWCTWMLMDWGPASVTAMTTHQITLGAINLEAQDPARLAEFWASVTGAIPSSGGDSVYLPPAGPGGFAMFFQPMTGPRPEHQAFHLDLTVPWGTRQTEVERLLSLGATHRWDVLDEVPHVQWTTLADREGNLFCVAEHPPADQQGL